MNWDNEPPQWSDTEGTVRFTVPGDTDYWRVTAHDFIADNAPFYHKTVRGDFTATAKVTGEYETLYDQAGLMVRASPTVWVKTGIEYVEESQQASTVITREFSDWSIAPLREEPDSVWVRVERTGAAVETFLSTDSENFTRYRQGYLTEAESLDVGVFAAAPQGEGFRVVVEEFTVD